MKRKGFTLIELLAVIVILAVIIAIAIPSVSSIMSSVKKNTFDSDAKLIIKSIKNRTLENPSLDVNELNKENLSSVIGVSDENIKDIAVTDVSGELQVVITGQNKWDNYVACGSYTNMKVSEGEYCTGIIPTDDSCFTFDSATDTITDFNESCSGDIVIPNTINGTNVEHIAPGAFTNRLSHYCYYHDGSGNQIETQVAIDYVHTDSDGYEFCWYNTEKTAITSVVLPKYLKTIGYTAFNNSQITSITIPNSVTDIGVGAFANSTLTNVIIGNNVSAISDYAFRNNQIQKVDIPDSVTRIGDQAFAFNQINSANFGANIETIDYSAFYSNQLTNLKLPNKLAYIGVYGFASNQITNVEFGAGVDTIDSDAFCSNQVTSVNFPEGTREIWYYVFEENPIKSVSIPSTVSFIGNGIVNNPELTTISVDSNNPTYKSVNNAVYTKDGKTLIIGTKGMSNNIESTVTALENDCFWNTGITNVTIPTTVTRIGTWALAQNALTSVTVPNSVTSIGESAFRYNNILQGNAKIDRASGTVTIGPYAFYNNGASQATTITPVYLR
jgi:prepilin-type N-terminal cleavage/methylation domain-containing protein